MERIARLAAGNKGFNTLSPEAQPEEKPRNEKEMSKRHKLNYKSLQRNKA